MVTTINLLTRKPVALKFFVLALVTACVVTAGAAARLRGSEAPANPEAVTPSSLDERGLDPVAAAERRPDRQPAFTVAWTRTATAPDGQSQLLQTTRRYQRADGAYKLVHTIQSQNSSAGRVETVFGFVGLGAFRLDEARRQLVFISPMTEEEPEDVEGYLRADPRFNREEEVQGQRSIVWRTSTHRDTGFVEEYRAPALGGLLIKRVEESARGRQVLEPTEIDMGEPAANLFVELEQYPADYARYEESIARADREQRLDAARLMRALMHRMKKAKPDKH